VVIAVPPVRMMQVPVHQVIHMIAVRYGLMTAIDAVYMIGRVSRALVAHRAIVRIGAAYLDLMLIVVVPVVAVQMTVVQVVDVIPMMHRGMPAPRPVDVDVVGFGVNDV
jgi:hypothetical protein